MDTYEARRQMRDLARDALDLLDEVADGDTSLSDALIELRKMELEARTLLADAGYPGEAAWRSLQRGVQALAADERDAGLIEEVRSSLQETIATLDSLTGATTGRDSDFRIVG